MSFLGSGPGVCVSLHSWTQLVQGLLEPPSHPSQRLTRIVSTWALGSGEEAETCTNWMAWALLATSAWRCKILGLMADQGGDGDRQDSVWPVWCCPLRLHQSGRMKGLWSVGLQTPSGGHHLCAWGAFLGLLQVVCPMALKRVPNRATGLVYLQAPQGMGKEGTFRDPGL